MILTLQENIWSYKGENEDGHKCFVSRNTWQLLEHKDAEGKHYVCFFLFPMIAELVTCKTFTRIPTLLSTILLFSRRHETICRLQNLVWHKIFSARLKFGGDLRGRTEIGQGLHTSVICTDDSARKWTPYNRRSTDTDAVKACEICVQRPMSK